jgi:hypothetical protein
MSSRTKETDSPEDGDGESAGEADDMAQKDGTRKPGRPPGEWYRARMDATHK